jgi:hypothetical protein
MKPLAFAFWLLAALAGCGDDSGAPDLAVAHDFAAGVHDLAVADARVPDLAVPDLATTPPPVCDLGASVDVDGGVPVALLFAGRGTDHALASARFTEAAGWTQVASNGAVSVEEVALAVAAGTPLVVARASDSTLTAASYSGCGGAFPTLTAVAGDTTSLRPAVVDGDVVFRGSINNDTRLYHTHFDGAAWTPPTVQSQLLTNTTFAVVRVQSMVHAIFAGTDGNLYDGAIADSPGGGPATQLPSAKSSLSPAAVVDGTGALHVVFTGNDTNLYWVKDGANPIKICPSGGCVAQSNAAPALALDATGALIAAFVGTDSHLYTVALAGDAWATPIAVAPADTTTLPPALATGIGAATAELVYARQSDGAALHARLVGGAWAQPIAIATVTLGAQPALLPLP